MTLYNPGKGTKAFLEQNTHTYVHILIRVVHDFQGNIVRHF